MRASNTDDEFQLARLRAGSWVRRPTQYVEGKPIGSFENDDTKIPESEYNQSLSRLRKFYAWGENWNGEGAPAPSGAALKAAETALGYLSENLNHGLAVDLNFDGDPVIYLRFLDATGELTLLGSNSFAYFAMHGDESVGDDSTLTPDELLRACREMSLL